MWGFVVPRIFKKVMSNVKLDAQFMYTRGCALLFAIYRCKE